MIYSSSVPGNHAPVRESVHDGTDTSPVCSSAGEYHTDDPEEDDIVSGNQYVGRIEVLQLLGVLSGQPSVENGHSAEENQVSSVSSSCVKCVPPHFGQIFGISRPQRSRRSHRSSKPESGVPTRAVLKYTSRGCSPASANMSCRSAPERTAAHRSLMPRLPASPSPPCCTNHCGLIIGSTVVLQRSCVPTLCSCGTTLTRSPRSFRSFTIAFLAS